MRSIGYHSRSVSAKASGYKWGLKRRKPVMFPQRLR